MPKTWCCPFFLWEKGLTMHCESGALRFIDAVERKEYISRYCASVKGWEGCTLARQISKRYEGRRKEHDPKKG